jgi:hypothetical protein
MLNACRPRGLSCPAGGASCNERPCPHLKLVGLNEGLQPRAIEPGNFKLELSKLYFVLRYSGCFCSVTVVKYNLEVFPYTEGLE